jgi:dihydrofolate synthase/folylpolyglutamate synthase
MDLAVLEVGLGGRLDATTAHPDRRVLGFASIGMDHREHLGQSLVAIAAEKAAVMKAGSVAISAPQHPDVRKVLEAESARLHCELRWVPPLASAAEGGPSLGLPGEWQRANAAVAVAMVRAMGECGLLPPGADLTPDTLRRGLAAARWPGRLERHHWRCRPLLIDGAHNPPAAAALRLEIDRLGAAGAGDLEGGQGRRWLLGIQRHKEGAEMLRSLLGAEDRAAIVPVPGHASWSAAELGRELPHLAHRLEALDCLTDGLDWLTVRGALPVLAGSLYLVGAALTLLDPED